MIRGVRGAITVKDNDEQEIISAAERLLKEAISSNDIAPNDVASIFISATDDIDAAFPARALRNLDGWTYVPVMCMQELSVPGSLQKCIRIMVHFNTEKTQKEIQHIYLEEAAGLRPDL
ncbi:chorismate mutase [Mesobacillus jeotgali]|uniref:chorismate mutase n=1 Tax=Mesobacillus jeotgali TaxID=129985 RepID=A0ABY9VR81_9BACI|nr:chorismate mutase [Mesobacillus jeotgali]WNF25236.1 chorismate mutase [Mesobacillus jeotgali]